MISDCEDQADFHPTILDVARLKEMEIGEKVDGECGFWHVLRYKKQYVLCILLPTFSKPMNFFNVESVINFLNEF